MLLISSCTYCLAPNGVNWKWFLDTRFNHLKVPLPLLPQEFKLLMENFDIAEMLLYTEMPLKSTLIESIDENGTMVFFFQLFGDSNYVVMLAIYK